MTAVGEEAVCEVGLLEVGHVDEGHATGVEAEEEHVAGIVEEWAGGEIELFHSGDVLYGYGALDGAVDPGVDVTEGVFLFGDAFLDGAVVDGTQAAHVGGDCVHGYAAGLEVGLVFGDGVGVDILDADVASVAETAETVERGFVGFACADFVEMAQSGDGGLHEGVETVTGRAHGGEGCGEGVGCADDVLMVVEVGEFGEEGQVGAEALAGVGEVAETRGATEGGDEDVRGGREPFVGVERKAGVEVFYCVVVGYQKIETTFFVVDRRGSELDLDRCFHFVFVLVGLQRADGFGV